MSDDSRKRKIYTRVDHVVSTRDVWNVFTYHSGVAHAEIGVDFDTEDQARNAAAVIESLSNTADGSLSFPLSIADFHGGERYEVDVTLRIDGGECADYPTIRLSGRNCNLEGYAPGEYVLTPLSAGGES